MPLVIKRSEGENIVIPVPGGNVVVTVSKRKGCVYLVVEAPPEIRIVRGELYSAPLLSGRMAS